MILIETGTRDTKNFAARIHFASQLAARGHQVLIDENTVPESLNRPLQYEAVPLLGKADEFDIKKIVIVGAGTVSDDLLKTLRGYDLNAETVVTAISRFPSKQAKINTQSKIAYALGFEPEVLDLAQLQPKPLVESSIAPLFAGGKPNELKRRDEPNLFLFVPKELLEEPITLLVLGALSNLHGFHCSVITAANGKDLIKKSRYSAISVYGYSELSPSTLAQIADIAVFFGSNIPGERMAAFALDLMRRSGLVIDCTESGVLATSGAPVLRGPLELNSLATFIQSAVLINRHALGQDAASHQWLKDNSIERLESALSLDQVAIAPETAPKQEHEPRTVFIPTNGVGIGHAQRCSLIAAAMQQPLSAKFAAYPSCIPMLQSKGFDCVPLVPKSDLHEVSYANDLLNYLRLNRFFRRGDKLIFDGGYVFDSIYRTIFENELSAVWIRRGLWQPGQVNETPLDWERACDAVVVPNEAFDELNSDYSFGGHIHHVGPIVQDNRMTVKGRSRLRNRLKKLFGHAFKKLVVTMLGGGVAADRSAQMQTLCALFHERTDCLHLIVVWPNARISSGLYGWDNSHVVKTQRALELCQASDLVVSAVGYNSFHEILYHRLPAIFIPQMAAFMDDQERRARAASERGYAVTVLSTELLMLEREVAAFLDNGKADEVRRQLTSAELPTRGNHAAAGLIEGISSV